MEKNKMGEDLMGIKTDEEKVKIIVEKSGLTPKELDTVLKNLGGGRPRRTRAFKDKISGHFKFGVFSDCHMGHEAFDEELFVRMAKEFKRQKVDRVYNCGDMLEGMSGRPGHVYELTHMGFQQQIDYAEEMLQHLRGLEVYGIDGNHDLWYKKKNNGGVIPGQELDRRVPHYHHLGEMEADVNLGNGIRLKLFHANDGTAYAVSYKMQKLIESFEGGKKPHLVLSGHYHKALYMFLRNVHGIEAGTLCGQSEYMRGKKIAAHKGFWIVEGDMGRRGVKDLTCKFHPSYD